MRRLRFDSDDDSMDINELPDGLSETESRRSAKRASLTAIVWGPVPPNSGATMQERRTVGHD
jgi:hypothetical protein